jgi:ABC-type sugar transport system substrate-binding protein
MKKIINPLAVILAVSLLTMGLAMSSFTSHDPGKEALAPAPKEFTVVWSIYAGWNPWAYAGTSGIMDKWAAKYRSIHNTLSGCMRNDEHGLFNYPGRRGHTVFRNHRR